MGRRREELGTRRGEIARSGATRSPPEVRRRVAREILALRRALGMTQRELAARSGLQQADISRLEAGRSNPTLATLAAVARTLGAEVSLLAPGTGAHAPQGRPRARDAAGRPSGPARIAPIRRHSSARGRRTRFLCLICAAKLMEQMTPAEAEAHRAGYRTLTARLWKRGQLLSCNRLLPTDTATTVRVRNGKVSVVDGPFAETKELVGGYFVIEAKDRAEAVRIASRIPGAHIGCVEVRPIAEDAATLRALGLSTAGA